MAIRQRDYEMGEIMTLTEIKNAVDRGEKVFYRHDGSIVEKVFYTDTQVHDYHIVYKRNDFRVCLTWKDGITMNGKEEDFFIGDTCEQ